MRRAAAVLVVLAAALVGAAGAHAAAPLTTTGTAIDIQGVSALLRGKVNPQGLPTTYSFQYVDQAGFEASGFAGATSTVTSPAGSGNEDRSVSAMIAGLTPSTGYRFRLVAQSTSGATQGLAGAFTTTAGFGFLPGESGFAASVLTEGGGAAPLAGSHPEQISVSFGFRPGGEFDGEPGVSFTDGDLRDLHIEMPPGMIQNPAALNKCSATDFHTPRSSPFEVSLSGESCPARTQVGVVEVRSSLGGGVTRRFGVFNLDPPPGIPSQIGIAPFGSHIVFNSDRGGSQQIYVMDANGGGVQRISFGQGRYGTPVWSPRGDLIAFTRINEGKFYVGVMKPDGSGERLLTEGYLVEGPTWSPNGRVLAFFREQPSDSKGRGGSTRLYTIDLTGSNERQVPTPLDASDPAWSPLNSQ